MTDSPEDRFSTGADDAPEIRDVNLVDDEIDTRALLAIAEAAVDEAEATFTAAVGADPAVSQQRWRRGRRYDPAVGITAYGFAAR